MVIFGYCYYFGWECVEGGLEVDWRYEGENEFGFWEKGFVFYN